MSHSPAMHSPHILRTDNVNSSFTPISATSQSQDVASVVRSHVPTPPRPLSSQQDNMVQSNVPSASHSPLESSSGIVLSMQHAYNSLWPSAQLVKCTSKM